MLLKDYLKNKNVVFYGDSITHNWEKYTHDLELTQGEDHVYGLGYGHVKMLNDVCNFKTINNYAVSGGCYANCSLYTKNIRQEWRHFPYQVNKSLEALKKADVIFIMFGTNDYAEQVHFGKEDDMPKLNDGNMSFFGGMNYGFDLIKKTNPKAKVFVINILNRIYPIEENRTYNYSYNEYNLAIYHQVKEYGFNLIDVSKLFNIPDNFVGGKGVTYSDDGVHPNHNGYEVLTNTILNYDVK